MRITYSLDASADLIAQYEYYVREASASVAEEFLLRAEETFKFIAQSPGAGAARDWLESGLRVFPVRGFRSIRVYYRVSGPDLRIVRVVHGARDLWAIFGSDPDPD